MSNISSPSHARWQGAVRWKQGWSSAWKGWDDSSATASPAQNPEQVSDERVANDMHVMQDRLQQTTVISPQALTENAFRASCIKDAMEAATQAREQQEEAGVAHDQKCQDAAEAESTTPSRTLLNTSRRATMRMESLATTEEDFCKTLLDRQKETQKHLDELSAQLCQTRATQQETRRTKRQAHAPA